ncbi:MAG: aspartate/glutamate racemase family protein [Bacillota bacterium]
MTLRAKVRKGILAYGIPIGILALDDSYACIPGDVRNALTYDFPVLYRRVEGLDIVTATRRLADYPVDRVVEAAQALEREGVGAITAECGYLALYQREVAAAVSVPVFLSSLMQVPWVERMLGPHLTVGVCVAEAKFLTPNHLEAVGITKGMRVKIMGVEDDGRAPAFEAVFYRGQDLDVAAAEADILRNVGEFVRRNPDLGALVLECSSYPPYARAIQREFGLPVFDYYTLIRFVFEAVCHRSWENITA